MNKRNHKYRLVKSRICNFFMIILLLLVITLSLFSFVGCNNIDKYGNAITYYGNLGEQFTFDGKGTFCYDDGIMEHYILADYYIENNSYLVDHKGGVKFDIIRKYDVIALFEYNYTSNLDITNDNRLSGNIKYNDRMILFSYDGTCMIYTINGFEFIASANYFYNEGVLATCINVGGVYSWAYLYLGENNVMRTVALAYPEYYKQNNSDKPTEPENPNKEYRLTYLSDDGGYIEGNANQKVIHGQNGDKVTAKAHEGYEFVGWSDGVMTAERQDTNIVGNKQVTAQFRKKVYTIEYTAEEGGYVQGSTSQSVKYGEDGTQVIAKAREGYEFIGWSDGVMTAERQDTNILKNMEIRAKFREVLPENTTDFDGGKGAEYSPYRISTVEHINNIEKYPSAYYILVNDIDLGVVNEGISNFVPLFDDIDMFNGNFNGNGKTIKNVSIVNNSTYYTGIFSCIGVNGVVNNLRVSNASIFGKNYVGTIAGYSKGKITNCEVQGKLSVDKTASGKLFLGGIAGKIENDFTMNSADILVDINEETIYNEMNIGGIIGFYSGNNLELTLNANVNINVVGEKASMIGGLIGTIDSYMNITINDSYTMGNITGNSGIGGLIGGCYSSYCCNNITINNSYTTGNITGNNTGEVTGSNIGGLLGVIDSDSNIIINYSYTTGNITGKHNIGGLLGYNSHYSSNITINDSYTTGDITGYSDIGGLLGYSNGDVTINNSYTMGDIRGNYNIGGLLGDSNRATINNSYTTGNITGDYSIGGLIGNSNRATINNSYTTGNITGNNSIGGLVGYTGTIIINNSYTTGEIKGTNQIGGFCGEVGENFVISNSFTISKIIADGKDIGALAGKVDKTEINNVHWLYYADIGVEYAVGYDEYMGIPTSIGSVKHNDIVEFYDLADKLNEGQDKIIWEHVGDNTLPTLKKESYENNSIIW